MANRTDTTLDYNQRVTKVVDYIRDNIDQDIDINTLAAISAFSTFHFHRIIKAHLGEPIGSYIIRERLEMAASLLKYQELSISEIAYRVGYDTPSSLTKAFIKLFNVSPSEYRKTKNYTIMTTTKSTEQIKLSRGKVVELETKTVLFINATGDYKTLEYGNMFQKMWNMVKEQGLYSAGIEHIALYYDNPDITDKDNQKCDVCLTIKKQAIPNKEIGVKEIPGGKFAQFTYIGEYQKVGAAYDKIYGELLQKSGLEARGNYCFEKYISDPRRTAPEKLKTEIYIPIY